MAESRLEKLGTVFSRVKGLIRGGALKYEDRPLWYDIYEAFPPKLEPVHDRAPVMKKISEIMYPEDIIRAQFYRTFKSPGVINLATPTGETLSERFVNTYIELANSDSIPVSELFQATVDRLASQGTLLGNQQPKLQEIERPPSGIQKISADNELP